MKPFAMRRPEDGPVGARRPDDGFILVEATSAGKTESLLVSDFNAARIVACLCTVLGIRIVPADAKRIAL